MDLPLDNDIRLRRLCAAYGARGWNEANLLDSAPKDFHATIHNAYEAGRKWHRRSDFQIMKAHRGESWRAIGKRLAAALYGGRS